MGSLAVAGWLGWGLLLGGGGGDDNFWELGCVLPARAGSLAGCVAGEGGGGGHSFSWWGGVWKILIWVFLSGVKNLFSDIPIARPGPNTYPKSENVDAPKRAL